PPGEAVRFCQHLLGEAVLGFLQGSEADAGRCAQLTTQARRDRLVHAVRIDAHDRLVPALVNVLVPERHAKLATACHQTDIASSVPEMVTESRRVADSTAAVINAMLPRLSWPEDSGWRPVWTALANSVSVPNVPGRGTTGSAAICASPCRGRSTTSSCVMSLSAAPVQWVSPRSNRLLQSPAHCVTGPALTQLPR